MKRVFIYQLSEVLSKRFIDFFNEGIEIYPDEFDNLTIYDYRFSDELIQAIEKETQKSIDEIDIQILNTIANNIAYETYSYAVYNGFYKWFANQYIKFFGDLIDAGNELVYYDFKNEYDLDSYWFKIDFSKMDKETKEYYLQEYETTDKKYLLDFLNYNFKAFEKYIEKKICDMNLDLLVDSKVLDDKVTNALNHINEYLSYAYELAQ